MFLKSVSRGFILFKHSNCVLNGAPLICNKLFLRPLSSRSKDALSTKVKSELDTNVRPLGEKVKETTKTASYLGVILVGVGITGALFYTVFSELFSSSSPNNIYTKASKLCLNDYRVQNALGEPITVFGEETRRRRRQHVTHVTYIKNGKKHLRMKFHLKGAYKQGTAQLEMQENDAGRYEYRYLFVEVDDRLQSVIILEDNRSQDRADLNKSESLMLL